MTATYIKPLLAILCVLSSGIAIAQVAITPPSSNTTIPLLSQHDIDRMATPGEGYIVLNKTTGCFNYFVKGTWNQLCGNCLPETYPYTIDSTVQTGSTLAIFYTKNENDTLVAIIEESGKKVVSYRSPARIKLPPYSNESVQLTTYLTNTCYPKQREIKQRVSVKKTSIAAPQKQTIEGKEITVRDISGTLWMCTDWLPKTSGNATPLVNISSNVCPAGWSLPDKKDWESLMQLYTVKPEEIFEVPSAENNAIGLSQLGAYSVEEKKSVEEGKLGSYWINQKDSGDNQYLINVTPLGYIIVSVQKEKARLNVRCIKNE